MRWLGFLANPKHQLRFMGSDLSDSAWTNMCNYIVILTKQNMWVVSEVTNDIQKMDTRCKDTFVQEWESNLKQRNLESETRNMN